ncbi:probable inactive peptidyl-prolyl cis-trans isomerase-like 6 [Thalassophryne amazonica]|uniref:probable inactive peptidyl-prolyl cis-trans isomerase-like 6 n=1 Tax=Thalassophryne amazonica TaxID=390379 RepID=UPI0014708C9C|nr:probable inactive peptidyl-prolyl cis-trans isomerase-like 6 [Thalassophryne amazonica]
MAKATAEDSTVHLEIVGLIKVQNFHVATRIAEGLKQKFPEAFLDPTIQPLLEFDWDAYLWTKKRELRGEVWQYASSLMCFVNGRLLGTEGDLASWAKNQWGFTSTEPQTFCHALAEDRYSSHLQKTGHLFVFMDIDIGREAAGRLLFELFTDVCPKTSKNFLALCTGEQGSSQSGITLCYKNSLFHRVVSNGWVQGGDISPGRKGNGGESIYGPTFEDESFAISHSKRGILGMANQGPHSNGSQFYITLQPTPWMDRTYVAFGQVVEGVDVLRRLEEVPTCTERPQYDCKVADCGIFKL